MPTIRNQKELEKFLKKKMYDRLLELQKKLPNYLEEYIRTEFYNQYTPKIYEREERLIKAITTSKIISTGNGYALEVYLDPNKVSYDPAVWSFWDNTTNSPVWTYRSGDSPMTVFSLAAEGIHGFIGENNNPPQTSGRFWEAFIDSIDHGGIYDFFSGFKSYLIKSGLPVK